MVPFFSLLPLLVLSLSLTYTHTCVQQASSPKAPLSPSLFLRPSFFICLLSLLLSLFFFLALFFFATPNCLWLAARQGKREQLAHKKYPISASDPPSQSRSAVVWRELSVLLGGSSLCRKKTGIERATTALNAHSSSSRLGWSLELNGQWPEREQMRN